MKKLMKNFDPHVFITSFSIITFFSVFSFIAAAAEDEGNSDTGWISSFLVWSFDIVRFPFHTLFWGIITEHMALYFPAILLNIAFYSLLIERIINALQKIKKVKT